MDDIESEVVVVGERRGRPLKMTVQRFLRICAWIEQGKTNTEACRIEQVRYTSFRGHAQKKPRWQKRYELADEMRNDFMRDYHIANIMRQAPKTVIASLWWLERKYPNKFALRAVVRPDSSDNQKSVGTEIPAERLAEYGKLMLEFAEENKAKAANQSRPGQAALPDNGSEAVG